MRLVMAIATGKITGLRKRYMLPVAALLIALGSPAIASAEEIPSIAAFNEAGVYSYHYWVPSTATVVSEGTVKFSNPYPTTYHGLKFTGGTAGGTPTCTGIPQAATEPIGAFHWEGECKFSKPGTYTFVCTVHPLEMTGTITVTNGEPTVTTEVATLVGEHEATLNGTVNPNGKTTEYSFNWGTTEAYGEKTPVKSAEGATGVKVSSVLSNLTPATTYHFQLVAKNEKGTTLGADQTLTTGSPPGPPSATTGPAGTVGETVATLKGTVNPDGRPTEYFFEWGTGEAYGQSTPGVPAGESHLSHAAAATLSSLSPSTVYHYRLVAKNTSSETATGADQTFTTLSPTQSPSTSTPQTSQPPVESPPASLFTAPEAPPSGAPLVAGSLKLTVPRHVSSVHGSLLLAAASAGGTLEVDLLAKGSSLAKSRSSDKPVRVGRFLRKRVSAGKLSFAIALSAEAKRALARRHSLALTVKITLTPPLGHLSTLTRTLTLRA
jgi:hypothetical protein